MNRPVHFEIHANDMDRCKKFYESVFGWTYQQMGPELGNYVLVNTGTMDSKGPDGKTWAGINGGMMLRKGDAPATGAPVNGAVITMDVENIDETIKKILAAGGAEAVAKGAMPGMAWLAYFRDTENNIFGIYQTDPNAK